MNQKSFFLFIWDFKKFIGFVKPGFDPNQIKSRFQCFKPVFWYYTKIFSYVLYNETIFVLIFDITPGFWLGHGLPQCLPWFLGDLTTYGVFSL